MITILWIAYGVFLGWMVTRLIPKRSEKVTRKAIQELAEVIGKRVTFYDFLNEAGIYNTYNNQEKLNTQDFYKEKAEIKKMIEEGLATFAECAQNDDRKNFEKLYNIYGALAKHLGVVVEERHIPENVEFVAVKKKANKK